MVPRVTRVHTQLARTQGYNATVIAYGQTGSGKTFTMEGYDYSAKNGRAPTADFERTPPHKLGVTPRAVQLLFEAVAERNAACAAAGDGARLRVMCSYVQVYREQVLDLLNPALPTSGDMAARGVPVGLKLRWARGREFFVDHNAKRTTWSNPLEDPTKLSRKVYRAR